MTGMSSKPWTLEPFIHPQWQKPELNFILSRPPLYTFELGTAKAHEVRMTNVRIFIFLIWKYILVISSSFLLKIVLQSSKRHAEVLCSSHPWGWSPFLPHPHSATPKKIFELSMLTVGALLTLAYPGMVPGRFLRESYLSDLCQNQSKKHAENQILGLHQDNVQAHTFAQFDLLMWMQLPICRYIAPFFLSHFIFQKSKLFFFRSLILFSCVFLLSIYHFPHSWPSPSIANFISTSTHFKWLLPQCSLLKGQLHGTKGKSVFSLFTVMIGSGNQLLQAILAHTSVLSVQNCEVRGLLLRILEIFFLAL